MAIGLAALGLLAFLLGCSGTFAEPQNSEPAAQCSLTGIWKNDRGHTIKIFSVSDTGEFSGVFYLDPTCSPDLLPFPLMGIQHQGLQPTFGFTVGDYLLFGPISVFVGQCLVDQNGKEELRTTWLQPETMQSAAEDWGAIRIGGSTFYRTSFCLGGPWGGEPSMGG